jgi:hypothetical protein
LIVSFFTRDQGKLRGVARAVRRPKSRFGSGLERLSHVRLYYFLRENQELARLDRCELCGPPVFLRADYATLVALDFLAEVSEQVQPEHEPNDAFFRLLLLVLNDIRGGLALRPPIGAGPAVAAELRSVGRAAISPGAATAVAVEEERAESEFSETPGWLWRAVTTLRCGQSGSGAGCRRWTLASAAARSSSRMKRPIFRAFIPVCSRRSIVTGTAGLYRPSPGGLRPKC